MKILIGSILTELIENFHNKTWNTILCPFILIINFGPYLTRVQNQITEKSGLTWTAVVKDEYQ